MENKLNFRRVVLLLKSFWIEGKKLIFMGIGATICLLIFLYYINTSKGQTTYINGSKIDIIFLNSGIQPMLFIYGLFIGGILIVSYIFKTYSNKSNATGGLLIPASYFEKLLAGLIICLILFPLVYCIIYFTTDYGYISYLNFFQKSSYIKVNGIKQNVPFINNIFNNPFKQFLGAFLCYQTFTIIGMIHFQKQALLKTVAIGIVSILAFIFINLGLFKALIDPIFNPMPIGIRIGGEKVQNLMNNFGAIFINIFLFVLPPIFIITAYFKLKEKQV